MQKRPLSSSQFRFHSEVAHRRASAFFERYIAALAPSIDVGNAYVFTLNPFIKVLLLSYCGFFVELVRLLYMDHYEITAIQDSLNLEVANLGLFDQGSIQGIV